MDRSTAYLQESNQGRGSRRSGANRHGFTVRFLKDLKARELDNAFRDFFIRTDSDPEARLLLWFAGHGHTMKHPVGEGYIVPANTPAAETDAEFRIKAVGQERVGNTRFANVLQTAGAKAVMAPSRT